MESFREARRQSAAATVLILLRCHSKQDAMTTAQDGMNYAPQGKPHPVCKKGEFPFAAVGLDHGHIYGQCNGLIEAGGELRLVYDPDPEKVAKFGSDVPLGRAAEPAEIAPCYVFLASDDSSYMTGQVLHPNGGEIIGG